MIEPISQLNRIYPVQAVEPTQQVGSVKLIRTNPSIINKAISQDNHNSSNHTLNNTTSSTQNKFVQGSEARLERLKSIYSEKTLKQMGVIECTTCSERRYVDGSNDPSVSFKTPTNISPSQSFAAVSAHESEHVANERANAMKENGEVISQSVVLHTATCPECGVTYTSGGNTTSVVKKPSQQHVKPGELVDIKL